jgi:hypothetical protein
MKQMKQMKQIRKKENCEIREIGKEKDSLEFVIII